MDNMDPEQRMAKLEERLDLLTESVEENNRLLASMARTLRWSFWGRLIIWVIVLALPFIVLGPFLKTIVPGLSSTKDSSMFGLPSGDQVKALLDSSRGSEQ